MNNSSVWLNHDKKIISSFRSLDILAKNHSSIYSNEFKIENLSINLQKSEVNLEIITNKINGTLSDSSRVSIRQALEISLKTDSTSKAVVNDY
jgi:2C-methyl-D-erythritol 2,4-cyclodiphosphate synthase